MHITISACRAFKNYDGEMRRYLHRFIILIVYIFCECEQFSVIFQVTTSLYDPESESMFEDREPYRYECLQRQQQQQQIFSTQDGGLHCNMTWDTLSCWPVTTAGQYAMISCPENINGIDPLKNATRFCYLNGTWANKANYNNCMEQLPKTTQYSTTAEDMGVEYATRVIYNIGFTVSTVALAAALFIFMYFRSLRCIRNFIHSHLIITFILRNFVWIILRHSLKQIVETEQTWACKTLVAVYNYAQVTNFFWMLVEGLYLHIIIVWTYQAHKIQKMYFLIIGWGLPLLIVIIWVAVRAHMQSKADTTLPNDDLFECWLPSINATLDLDLDYIYISPILLVLALNLVFLVSIIWVLVTKMRASTSWETRQLRKAVKATLLLFPLLGITYVIFIVPPSEEPFVIEAHKLINAFLQSFQGFFVAVFYCFLNGEVKAVLKKKFSIFQDSRSLSTRYTRTSIGWGNEISAIPKDSILMANGRKAESIRYCTSSNPIKSQKEIKPSEETDNML